ncbi:aromatic amino acid transaminase [Epibacterium ulvae]|uniref:amino acid aminotransferase n=1 Tax=Epibacterium ulvae TaxID=1156985 RepID=UPI00248FD795|nr:aromatic amino acid transaminase [Epibacterium ulvae]
MLHLLPTLLPDPIWGLTAEFQADPRPEKLDLIVGVYRDENGQTPTLDVVKAAECQLAETAATKAYRPLAGNASFNASMTRLLLGDTSTELERAATIQTVGGTGALRLLGDFIKLAQPAATIWTTDPGYINHRPIFETSGLRVRDYPWRQSAEGIDVDLIFHCLADARPGDVLLIHGCCHNPSGIDPSAEDWAEIAAFCAKRELVPLVDIAYQGFGDGLSEDTAGLHRLVETLPLVLCSASCSKNMGLYCDRLGVAMVVAPEERAIAKTMRNLENLGRTNYSMPPEHSAAVANLVFNAKAQWVAELDAIRNRVSYLRKELCDTLERQGTPASFQALRRHKGMFSLLPLSPTQMQRLRSEYGIYGSDTGRVNIAGLRAADLSMAATAIADVAARP